MLMRMLLGVDSARLTRLSQMRRFFSAAAAETVPRVSLTGAPSVSFPARVKLVEVGPRDGLQAEGREIPTRIKARRAQCKCFVFADEW